MAANVQFKFRDDTSSDDRQELIAKLEDNGAERVEALFPDATDDELTTLYRAMVGDDSQFSKLMRLLKRSRKVEFAEPEADRRLILPQELKARASQNGSVRRSS
jgi:Asp-tRNA(Asn)/Glu-tRNA(Gln) amidotransferase A subunit family amidase